MVLHSKQKAALALLAVAALLPAGCTSDGHFTLLGYTTAPNYDCNIRTVYVPIFENRTFYRGWEFGLTQAVIRTIEARTPYKVVHDCEQADTELIGSIVNIQKTMLNRNQLNEVREAEMVVTVELTWRDRRTGEVLSQPGPRSADTAPVPAFVDVQPSQMGAPVALGPDGSKPAEPAPAGPGLRAPPSTLISAYASFIPELGETITTAQQKGMNRVAVQIVNMMERPW